MSDALAVAVSGKRVGTLTYENYAYTFRYDQPRDLDPKSDLVSLTMPVRAQSYDTQVLPPPFQSVLPEGDLLIRLRARFGKALNLDDDFQLLRLVGRNTIGRVMFYPDGEKEAAGTGSPAHAPYDLVTVLRHPDAVELLTELIDTYGIRSGIGGVHPKALLESGRRQLTVTSGDLILKAAGPEFPHLPVNEHFCLMASKAAGISTADTHLKDTGDLLAIERFDRTPRGDPLAFEEMCALRHLSRHGKYDGGYEDIAQIIRQIPCHHMTQALEQFFAIVALAIATRNGDAHLKNFGVLYHSINQVELAPAYDLVTTTVYLSKDLPALELEGHKRWPTRKRLEQFGLHTCDLRPAVVRRCLERVRSAVSDTAIAIARFGRNEPRFRALCDAMEDQWTLGLRDLC